jgi:transposase-like protein
MRVLRQARWVSKTIGSPGLMDPQEQWGRNRACRAYGRRGEGYAAIHSRAKRRYRCKRCRRTFAETPLHRLRTARDEGVTTVTLLAYGCPVQAMLATFGLDEWTVARWQARAGQRCRRVHEHLVQVDEIRCGRSGARSGWRRPCRSRAGSGSGA